MIAMLFIGLFTFLFGAIIIANSAFTSRGNFGFAVCILGLFFFGAGVVGLAVNFIGGP